MKTGRRGVVLAVVVALGACGCSSGGSNLAGDPPTPGFTQPRCASAPMSTPELVTRATITLTGHPRHRCDARTVGHRSQAKDLGDVAFQYEESGVAVDVIHPAQGVAAYVTLREVQFGGADVEGRYVRECGGLDLDVALAPVEAEGKDVVAEAVSVLTGGPSDNIRQIRPSVCSVKAVASSPVQVLWASGMTCTCGFACPLALRHEPDGRGCVWCGSD